MKSRTSFFDKTVFLKDLTRFCPAWILYILTLVVAGTIMAGSFVSRYYTEFSIGAHMSEYLQYMGIIHLIFALLNAQLLFGDLFKTKLANALHALPLRRETWFGTHVVAGILFCLVPNLGLVAVFTFLLEEFWFLAWYWLLAVMLQYLFYFGLAVFACMCVGSRFAQSVIYGLCSFGAWLMYWTLDVIYMPLIPGIAITFELLSPFCPLIYGFSNVPFDVSVKRYDGRNDLIESETVKMFPEVWMYLAVIAAIGVVLLILARQMYRKRNLECAGDFIAVSWLKPVFLVLYTLSMGMIFQYVIGLFGGPGMVFLIVGLLVGFLSGTMFLERTTKIFHKRMFAGLAIFAAVLLGSMGITALDPLDLEHWVPDPAQIRTLTFHGPGCAYSETVYLSDGTLAVHPHADRARITEIHQTILANEIPVLEEKETTAPSYVDPYYAIADTFYGSYGYYSAPAYTNGFLVSFDYALNNGVYLSRVYAVAFDSPVEEKIVAFMNQPDQVLGIAEEKWQTQLSRFYLPLEGRSYLYPSYEESRALMDAILADCEAGTMAQHDYFHEEAGVYLTVRFGDSHLGTAGSFNITVYPEAVNTVAWMMERDLYQLPEDTPDDVPELQIPDGEQPG